MIVNGRTTEEAIETASAETAAQSTQEREVPPPGNPPPVWSLLFAFMFMFQGYGLMNGNPQHVLKTKLGITHDQAAAFQNAAASFQLVKLLMRVCQISFLVFLRPSGIVYLAYAVMFCAVLVPILFVWCLHVTDLWVVYLQYSLGGMAIGLFEGTFLSVISGLDKNTKTVVIMGAPLGFGVHNIILGTWQEWGMPPIMYYVYSLVCLPIAAGVFYSYAPKKGEVEGLPKQGGCQLFMESLKNPLEWLPMMIPWFIAKFLGNFVLENAFPLLFNTFNTDKVPLFGGPSSTDGLVPFAYYTAWYWFVLMALGDTISRRVPKHIELKSQPILRVVLITLAIVMCVGGEALNFLLIPILTGLATFIANFGNGFIYGLSAKFIADCVPPTHHYAAYNLWCFFGDLGGYAGQSGLAVTIADSVCDGRHYKYICAQPTTTTTTLVDSAIPAITTTSAAPTTSVAAQLVI